MRLGITAALLLTVGCGGPESARIDPALSALVPADTILLAGVRIDKLRETPAWQKHFANRDLPFLGAAARETGIDLKRDVWEVLIVSNGADAVAYARGKFTERGTEPPTSAQARRMPYKGYTLLGNDRAAVAFLSSSTAVAGTPASVMAAIDRKGSATGPPRVLRNLIRKIPPQNQVWVVAAGTPPELPGNVANFAKALSMAETLSVAADVSAGLSLNLEAVGKSDHDAVSLNDALRGMIGLAILTTRDKELKQALNAVAITREERTVRASLTLTDW